MDNQRVAIIDLSRREVKLEEIPFKVRRQFLGGRGINMYLLYHHTPPLLDPFDLENPLIVGAGLLSGLPCPCSSRGSISGKSPETGLLGDSNIGGFFAPELRRTGYDHLVIIGKSKIPVYIWVEDGEIFIKDAAFLWGHDTLETMEILKNKHGDKSQSLCIGQAGENLVRFATVRHGKKSTAGRTGMGCLMGYKGLKAVVVKGNRAVPITYKREFLSYARELFKRIRSSRATGVLNQYGTPFLFDLHNIQGIVRTLNGKLSRFEEGRKLRSPNLKKYYTEARGCFSCPIRCEHPYVMQWKEKGEEVRGEGIEYGVLGAFGPLCGVKDLEAVLAINQLLNKYGLDASSTGNIIAWTMELFELGMITAKDTGGLSLRWGDQEVIITLINQIAKREGFGNVLADGAKVAATRLGEGSQNYLTWVKYLPQSDSVDVRVHKGFALGVATSTRGADHLRSRPTLEALNLTAEELLTIYGGEVSNDPTSYKGKARMVWWTESFYAVADALGLCRFVQKFNSTDHLGFEEFRTLIHYATGMELSPEELFIIGERITTLERMFLVREGIRREDDTLPSRYFEPISSGPYKGESIDRECFNRMLDQYYQLHGWDQESGIPQEETVKRLGLLPEQGSGT